MERSLQRLIVFIFLIPHLWISRSHAQNMETHEVTSAQGQKDERAYLSAIDGYSIEDLRETLARVWEHGLNPKTYWTESMEKSYLKDPQNAALKDRANRGFLKLLMDLSIGAVNPESMPPNVKLTRKKFLSPKQLQAIVVSTGLKAPLLLDTLAPQSPPYLALQTAIKKIYPACSNGQWVSLPRAKKTLKLGVKDPAVTALKNQLAFLGYAISNRDDVVDAETVNAINDLEWNMRVKPDGAIKPGGDVWRFINTPCMTRVRQLQADMEKLRWFPQQFGDRYVFINLAMSYFVLVDKTQNPPYVTSFRTINGRPARKSPTMIDSVVRVIINPYWIVPPTIFIEDKVKEIRALPRWQIQYYFDSHNYEVWNHEFTKRINPQSINWWAFDSKDDATIFIRQKPNYWNALGVVKFELTNSFSVYLHDTGQRELFYEADRLISSGCIRLERPIDFAEYLLKGTEWDRAKIESAVAKPGQVMTRDTKIELQNPIPVYTLFLTSFLGSDNILRFTEDSYGQNANILENLGAL